MKYKKTIEQREREVIKQSIAVANKEIKEWTKFKKLAEKRLELLKQQ